MRSEVTLNADVKRDGVLILVLVASALGRTGLRSCGSQSGSAGELLVEVPPENFGRERQVLDRSPAGDRAQHRDVEVGVADEVGANSLAGSIDGAEVGLGGGVIANGRVAAEHAGRPVRIPVVVERTTDTVRFGQMQSTIATGKCRKEDGVGRRTETNALVSVRTIAAAEPSEARRGTAGGDDVLGVTLGRSEEHTSELQSR